MSPIKRAMASSTIKSFGAVGIAALLILTAWLVCAIMVPLGQMDKNPIPEDFVVAATTSLGLSVWGIHKRLKTHTSIRY